MQKYVFIVNPVAGKGRAVKIVPYIEAECKKQNKEYEIIYTKQEENLKEKLYKYTDTIFYAVGGDGLISQILNAIIGTNNKLSVIPAGSGNDFYKVIKNLEDGDNRIDIGKINNQYFANVACVGIDAEVANNIEKLRETKIPTSQLYNASILYTFLKYKPKEIEFKTKIKKIKTKPMIISICNGSFYGGGYKIAPKSSLKDGTFDVYYADNFRKIHMLSLIPKLKKGKHEGKRYIHKFRTNHVEIVSEEELIFNVDGEKLKGKSFNIDIVPNALDIHMDKRFLNNILKNSKLK